MTTRIIKKKEKGVNRHWKNFIDKNYLGSHNLEKGEELLVTIEKFEGEEPVLSKETNEKVPKMVLYFKEDVPKMIMNITNGNTLTTLYGSHPENWIGKQIQIFSTPGKFFGKVQDTLRIRDVIPKISVDNKAALAKMKTAKNLEELKTTFLALTSEERNDSEVIRFTNEQKKKYASTQKP